MHPRHRPRQPTVTELRERGRKFPPNYLHESWADYLYWDSELNRSRCHPHRELGDRR